MAELTDSKISNTALELDAKTGKEEGISLPNPMLYSQLVGSLLYLTMSRPNICHAVQIVSHFVGNHRKPHLTVIHWILRYIEGSLDWGLFFPLPPCCFFVLIQLQSTPDVLKLDDPPQRWCIFLGTLLIS
eukprot:TRINITY_DN82807_c0_g1_i1.p1 TRINITY_DN82807_c0_g1~~TRINITY_DN82807_c0_g1_i1.p1  ORF type:complete len:130 (+),score=14.66 TRINITY_DN82807_c0_g1_i1:295-684(+)